MWWNRFLSYTELYDLALTVVQNLDVIIVAPVQFKMHYIQNFLALGVMQSETNTVLSEQSSAYFHSVQEG